MSFRLEVKNFQSIEHADLEIDQLTVITGTNSAGKSALVRAIKGVFVNSPAKNLVRKGADDLEVSLTFADGNAVTWRKGKNCNAYVINGDEKENVSRGAPEDIVSLGILPVEVTGSQKKQFWPQIAQQMDSVLFVLDEPGTTVAEVVVSDVDKVFHLNQALALSEKQRREFRAEEKIRRKDLETFSEKIERLSTIRTLSEKNKGIRESLERLTTLCARKEQMERYEIKWSKIQEERGKFSQLKELSFPDLSHIQSSYDRLIKLARLFQKLKGVKSERTRLENLGAFSIPQISIDLKPFYSVQDLQSKMIKIQTNLSEIEKLESKYEAAMTENENRISDILLELKVCPTCGRDS